MNKYLLIAIFTTVAVLGGLVLKGNRDALLREIDEAKSQVVQLERQAQQATQALQARDELDKQRFKEMSDAKKQIDNLRDQLAVGTKRVLVHASCPPAVSAAAGTTSLDDAREPALTAIARQDYLRLREQIITTEAQLAGLQEYYRQVGQGAK
ncbi:lysis protein [Pseudomonas plecoglossicida]|nr:lysis protein [Pseudomonas plecoglossicida]EPB94456.1 endopeptidase [Pseudomonas plecoglossicida NB2011]QLB56387.1 lysis protein [Pseudomonas plecoglossicida]